MIKTLDVTDHMLEVGGPKSCSWVRGWGGGGGGVQPGGAHGL